MEKIAEAIGECSRMKLPVLPPDVNESLGDFAVVEIKEKTMKYPSRESIRFGLYTVKNLGKEIADAIIEERLIKGKYKSFSDFLDRVQHKNLKQKIIRISDKVRRHGREFGERNKFIFNMEDALAYNKESGKSKKSKLPFSLMTDVASLPELRFKETEPASQNDKLLWEKELLGLYISGHPLDKFKDKMEKIKTKSAT